ncbi:hypothetical protein BBJ28_00004134 [Nothophytophthora sp. Chile5]|nr:hypothetical protein BBJ28_00004134 [Nothophytophthora sp. Chile5]
MDLRFQSLQQRYPDLVLDVALISTQRLTLSSGAMRTTSYNYEALEVVVLTRGRRCTDDGTSSAMAGVNCTTVFVDDYRYERDIVQTNLTDWYGVISMLRGGAQCYVWTRLALLVYGASIVATAHASATQTVAGNPPSKSHLFLTISTVLKIPFQVIVYSSPLPVAGYVLALLLDSNFMDIFLDSYWASVSGAVNFRLVPFLESTAVQMRNVWLLALLANLLVSLVRKTRDDSSEGMPGIRGLVISFTSTLTVSGPYKNTAFRDTRIVNMFRIPHTGQTMDIVQSNPGGYFNTSSYIFGDSANMLMFCVAFVAALAVAVKALNYFTPANGWLNRSNGGVILSSTPIVPCGTATLWPTSALSIRFSVMTRPPPPRNGPRASYVRALATSANPLASTIEVPPTNDSTVTPSPTINMISLSMQTKGWPWPSRVQPGGPTNARTIIRKEPPGGLRSRTTEAHSLLQLMNIAMMTDPWNLFWLRVLGIQLYLYKIRHVQSIAGGIRSSSRTSYAVILPYREDEMEERTGLNSGDYLLLDSASSRDVPMAVLLQCG